MKWISVKERLPEERGEAKPGALERWIYDPAVGVRRTTEHSGWWNMDIPDTETVTHWMDVIVPEPPEVKP